MKKSFKYFEKAFITNNTKLNKPKYIRCYIYNCKKTFLIQTFSILILSKSAFFFSKIFLLLIILPISYFSK